jgi:hypothetical protein
MRFEHKMTDSKVSMGEMQQSIDGTCLPDEYAKLSEFAAQLSSFHSITDISNDSINESNIREEAQLLMNLLSPTTSGSCATKVSIGNSSSMPPPDFNDFSVSNTTSTLTNQFSFTCPTLSLERQNTGSEQEKLQLSNSRDELHPAQLLGRSLKVEDRDALRLSSDAMARNIFRSFQHSLQTRVEDWISILTRQLLRSEKELALAGAESDKVHALLQTSEAMLISKLQNVGKCLSVTSVRTSFHVLPEKVDINDNGSPTPKRQRVDVSDSNDEFSNLAIEVQDSYSYTVYHRLKFQCIISVETPAGFGEVSIDVPGIVEGTFCSVKESCIQIVSVRVKLDTNMLAAMMDKSCRTLVRASVEAFLESENLAISPVSPQVNFGKGSIENGQGESLQQQNDTETILYRHSVLQPHPVFITPKPTGDNHTSTSSNPQIGFSDSSPILMPVAEDLASGTEQLLPRRSLSHLSNPECVKSNDATIEGQTGRLNELYHVTRTDSRAAKMERSKRLPLISPPPSETQFKDLDVGTGPMFPSFPMSPKIGPAWPMLVEAAHFVKEEERVASQSRDTTY